MTTADRLRSWLDLFQTREDLVLDGPVTVEAFEAPDDLPEEARAFARTVGRTYLAWKLASDTSKQGSLFLDLSGIPAMLAWMTIDGRELGPDELEQLYELEQDRLGTGFAAWYWVQPGGAAKVVWSLEDPKVFDSLEAYLDAGVRAGFSSGWQWGQPSALEALSVPRSTPPAELEAALVRRGATPEVAKELVSWLGGDAAMLVPDPAAGQRHAKAKAEREAEAAARAKELTLFVYRPGELPQELQALFPLTDAVRRSLFWVTRGGPTPAIEKLFEELPEPSIDGVEAGSALMKLVSRIVSTATENHLAVGAQGSFKFGFHGGDAAQVEAFLKEQGVRLAPLRDALAKVLVVQVADLPDDVEWLGKTQHGRDGIDDARAAGPGIFAFDRDDSSTRRFTLERKDGVGRKVEVCAADVPPGTVVTIRLG